MNGPNTDRMERELSELEEKTKHDLSEIVPEIEALTPETVDEELLNAIDSAVEAADERVKEAQNGKEKK